MKQELIHLCEKTYTLFRFKRRITEKTLFDVAKAIAGVTLYHPTGHPFFYIFALEGEHDLEPIQKATGRDDIKREVVLGRHSVPFRIW
ncbi:MAG: hypothetical protein HZA36_00785 [Parcubacteria group bacterium]|nr:hypothetical protein [Parcubacteria group bacterium]